MYVKNRMTKDPYTIQADAPITEVVELMRIKNLKRIPVLDGERVVGILTDGDIQKVSPTKATALSVFEINYLLAKTTVRDAMTKKVVTISPEDILEEAAVLMRANRVSSLPVIDGTRLVGIITESDIFDAFIDLLGGRDIGTRLVIETDDKPGILSDVANIVSEYGANINHIAAYRREEEKRSDVVIRMDTLDSEAIIQSLEKKGYEILSITKNRS
ncbi:CBS and ACT domain-containing protein [Sinanaerobacter sp. ZZT-01]|uniref:CBS and ACT domain-containing protein n=1 Tax=Sinanaerobacter sp. ZZT-01 TaxID=3111540 RepID=UPI002D79A6E0|nr:CBS and ACT domain-containing protein [Sinanaerobacter sp. ZZT-01]WRR93449.1 CBS and ACT domain-containing protein [Sinanaerobacter sp. ZZT-01]